jgi:hypothetical protein
MTDYEDPYGLPRFDGEDELTGWTDHSEIALRTVRVFTRGTMTIVIIAHRGVWDLITSDGQGQVSFHALGKDELAEMIATIAP